MDASEEANLVFRWMGLKMGSYEPDNNDEIVSKTKGARKWRDFNEYDKAAYRAEAVMKKRKELNEPYVALWRFLNVTLCDIFRDMPDYHCVDQRGETALEDYFEKVTGIPKDEHKLISLAYTYPVDSELVKQIPFVENCVAFVAASEFIARAIGGFEAVRSEWLKKEHHAFYLPMKVPEHKDCYELTYYRSHNYVKTGLYVQLKVIIVTDEEGEKQFQKRADEEGHENMGASKDPEW